MQLHENSALGLYFKLEIYPETRQLKDHDQAGNSEGRQSLLVVTLSTQRGFPFSRGPTNLPGRIAIQQGRYQ